MLTSLSNEKVKYARSLHHRTRRYQERHFIADGVRLIEEALRAGVQPALIFCTPEGERLAVKLREVASERLMVSREVMKALSALSSPPGILAVLPFPELAWPAEPGLALVVDGVQEPGNLGSLLRSAEAGGVEGVVLTPGTVDPYNPKVVRGGMGVHFRLPITLGEDWSEVERLLAGMKIYLATPEGGQPYYEVDWRGRCALVVGSEARGPSSEAERLATERISIPMAGGPESLNVAVAGSVILFEAARQRRTSR